MSIYIYIYRPPVLTAIFCDVITCSFQDKVDSFGALLRESGLSAAEQEQVMNEMEGSLRDLEADYLRAIERHGEEQRRASIATGGAINATQDFDPDRSMEEEITMLVMNLLQGLQCHHIQ